MARPGHRILRLRQRAQRELGPCFDIRVFHDKVLEDGTVTLPMLCEKIERWVAEAKQAPTRKCSTVVPVQDSACPTPSKFHRKS